MPATIFGVSQTLFHPQADFSASQSENGGWTARQSFVYRGSLIDNYAWRANFVSGKKPTQLDSGLSTYWDFLGLVNVEVQDEEGGISRIIVTYSGTPIAEGGNGESQEITTYSLSGSVSQFSIIEHDKVRALGDDDRRKLGQLLNGGIYYDEQESRYRQQTTDNPFGDEVTFSAGDASTFATKIVEGFTTFDGATIYWSEYKERNTGLTAAELNDLQKISTPAGSPPAVTGSRNWKLVSATQDFDGMLYRINRQWQLSLPGGWDTDLYD